MRCRLRKQLSPDSNPRSGVLKPGVSWAVDLLLKHRKSDDAIVLLNLYPYFSAPMNFQGLRSRVWDTVTCVQDALGFVFLHFIVRGYYYWRSILATLKS